MIPRSWMVLGVVIDALAALLAIQTTRLSKEQAAHMETQRNHALALAEATERARQTERSLRADLEQLQVDAAKEKESAKAREDALVESVRSGERRLRIAAVCPGAGSAGLRPPVAGSSGAGLQVAELDGPTSERILGITIDGDSYIRERNACVAAYEALRKRLNSDAAQ